NKQGAAACSRRGRLQSAVSFSLQRSRYRRQFSKLVTLFGGIFLFVLLHPLSAAVVAPEANTATLSNSWQMTPAAGILMLVLLFTAFFAMTRYEVPLPLAMSLVSLCFLLIQWESAPVVLRTGFEHYADITVLFTAVAIPAHMIERSHGFKWIAAWLGHQ